MLKQSTIEVGSSLGAEQAEQGLGNALLLLKKWGKERSSSAGLFLGGNSKNPSLH